ncbi:hypothetical protein [Vreelandella venusta]|uniref:hypothetical protein n=1 Tax=Vreelandella venusta TaxID=44935 RepID=UPI00200F163E|nr:hypothetical protein [Halomonas venusta]UQI41907.1 hypothetical protein M3L73_06515 [Halomonas venusta]
MGERLPPLSEAIVQDVVYAYCSVAKHEITVPNCGSVWGAEADIASVTKSRLGHAFEIKVSRADWLSELRQIRGDEPTAKHGRALVLSSAKERAEKTAEMHAKGSNCCGRVPPNYFWMVTAPGIIQSDELPEYAGLMEIEPYRFGNVKCHGYMIREVRPAPRLHRVKLLDIQIMAMARGVSLRYWQQRRKSA